MGTIEDPWDDDVREDAATMARNELELLQDLLRFEGFSEYAKGEWCKIWDITGRYIQVVHNGDKVMFNFNEDRTVLVKPSFVINFFMNRPDVYK